MNKKQLLLLLTILFGVQQIKPGAPSPSQPGQLFVQLIVRVIKEGFFENQAIAESTRLLVSFGTLAGLWAIARKTHNPKEEIAREEDKSYAERVN